jgi:hypothetical protein
MAEPGQVAEHTDARGSQQLVERLAAQGRLPKGFAEELVQVLSDAQLLEISRRGGGAQIVFSGDPDGDWCGNSTTKILNLRRKYGVPMVVDWFPYGIIQPDLLLGRIRVSESLVQR